VVVAWSLSTICAKLLSVLVFEGMFSSFISLAVTLRVRVVARRRLPVIVPRKALLAVLRACILVLATSPGVSRAFAVSCPLWYAIFSGIGLLVASGSLFFFTAVGLEVLVSAW